MKNKGTVLSYTLQVTFVITIIGLMIFDIARVEMFVLLVLYIVRYAMVVLLSNMDNPYRRRREKLRGRVPSNT